MVTGTTSLGFEYEIDERWLNDYRFVDAVAKADAGSPTEKLLAITSLCNFLLKPEDKQRLEDRIASENDGFVPQEVMYKVIFEIINDISAKNKETKNS